MASSRAIALKSNKSAARDFLSGGGKMEGLIRAFDWSKTSLGPITTWPQSLRAAVNIMLQSPVAMVMLWGKDGVMIYNDAYAVFAGGRHPSQLGTTVAKGWPEVADFNRNVLDKGLRGKTLSYKNQQLTVYRHGEAEEVWVDLNYSPVMDENGKPAAVLAIVTETTKQVLAEHSQQQAESTLLKTQVQLKEALAKGLIGAWTLDVQTNLVTASESLAKLFGADPEQATAGLLSLDVFVNAMHPEDRERVTKSITKAIKTGKEYEIDYRVFDAKGQERWVLARGQNEKPPAGSPPRFTGVLIDITERKKAEEALKESDERFRSLADNMSNLAWMANPEGWIYWYNSRWYEYTGTTPKDMEGWGWQSVHDPKQLPRVLKRWQASIKTGEPFDMVFPLKGTDGQFRPFLTRVVPVKDQQGSITHWFGTNTDITKQVRAEEQQKELSQQLVDVLESMGDAFFMLDKDWRVTRVNHHQEKVSETNRKDTIGKSFWEVFPATADPKSNYWIEYHKVAKTKKPSHFIEHYGPLDVWTEVNAYPTPDGGISVFFRDISQRKQAEDALKESEARLRFMAESMPQKVFTATPNGEIDYFNPQWIEFTGLAFEEMLEWGWIQLVHPDDLDENIRRWQHSIKTGEPFELEHRFLRADGQYRWHVSRAQPMRDSKGNIVRWFGSNTDIEDIRRTAAHTEELEQKTATLKEQRAQLVAINSAKDEFISLASHQLRTPATSVKQYIGMMLEGYAEEVMPTQRDFLQRAYDSNERQLNIVNDLLKVASVDAGKVKPRIEKFDLSPLIKETLEGQAAKFTEREQNVTLQATAGKWLVSADRDLLRMVLENLIDNASKYTYQGKAIKVKLLKSKGNVEISIQDEGVGVPEDKLNKLFQKFSRLDNPLSIAVGGTGLGLYWVRKIIDLHHGTITVASQEGKGSTFTVTLPMKRLV